MDKNKKIDHYYYRQKKLTPKLYPSLNEYQKKRIKNYLKAIEDDNLNGYYNKYYIKKGIGLFDFCPICGLRKVYVVFDSIGNILKIRCANPNCVFIYNPSEIDKPGERIFASGQRNARYEKRGHVLNNTLLMGDKNL